ncbi:AAA family ATPase [Mesorhizobium sp. SB112]|uniref:AAA family ATPase n=1 Tax=Mesorhizobium sp. SB112 TaxID=3151853 RepID=UPI003262EC4C
MSKLRKIKQEITKSVAAFLAYCGTLRACLRQPGFMNGLPAVVGLVIPENSNLDIYRSAAKIVSIRDDGGDRLFFQYESTAVFARDSDDSKMVSRNSNISDAIREKPRVVVVVDSRDSLPKDFEFSADNIIQIQPYEARHIMAACRFCLGQRATLEQAEFIVSVPLDIIAATMRKGRPISVSIERMKLAMRAKDQPEQKVSEPTLNDLHGFGEAGAWGNELAKDLADWKSGKIPWHAVDRGVLLSGPPGTGKTTFAGALARTSNAHLVLGSLGRWQAKGHLGDLLKAMRRAFNEAKNNAPSIIFLDEIDAFGDREKFNDDNAQYHTEVVSALLECIDGAEGREGVVVVGACNYPARIDAAITRPGRLDRHIQIPLPDLPARLGIFRWHLQTELADIDLANVCIRSEGWSGAAIEKLVRDARRKARRASRPLSVDDLLSEFPAKIAVPEAVRRRAAIHEAGHAVVGLALGLGELERISIVDEVDPSVSVQTGGGAKFEAEEIQEHTSSQYLQHIAVCLAGLAAEEAILGSRSAGGGGRAGSDLHTATIFALMMEATYGMGDQLVYLSSAQEADLLATLHIDRELKARVSLILSTEFQRAKQFIEEQRQDVERLADALLMRGELTKKEVDALISERRSIRA